MPIDAPIIMTAAMGAADFAWADGLRRRHFPPERNLVPAHITLFHHLPPRMFDETVERLRGVTREQPRPDACLDHVMKLSGGVAFRVVSPILDRIRADLADNFHGMLTPQDQAPPRLHITIQNKAKSSDARALYETLAASFEPRPLAIAGLALHAYRAGPWEPLGSWSFRGHRRSG